MSATLKKKNITLKPEWYYSENDLSSELNEPVNIIRDLISDQNLKPIYLLNRRLFKGKTINDVLKNTNISDYQYKRQKKTKPLQNNKEYNRDEIIHMLDMSDFKFMERYIKEFGLEPSSKNQDTGTSYYKGSDVNKITKAVFKNQRPILVYPEMVVDDRSYYTSQLTQALKINHKTFKQLYIETYHLESTHTKKVKGHSQPHIMYNGADVNKITHLIREDYYNEPVKEF